MPGPLSQHVAQVFAGVFPPGEEQRDAPARAARHDLRSEDPAPLGAFFPSASAFPLRFALTFALTFAFASALTFPFVPAFLSAFGRQRGVLGLSLSLGLGQAFSHQLQDPVLRVILVQDVALSALPDQLLVNRFQVRHGAADDFPLRPGGQRNPGVGLQVLESVERHPRSVPARGGLAPQPLALSIQDTLHDATAVRTAVPSWRAGPRRQRHVTARPLATDPRGFRLRVTDHGPGVAVDVTRRLFRPFCRSAQDAANSAPGAGLSLALSRRLARRLGGDLTLVPNTATGASFELKLPAR